MLFNSLEFFLFLPVVFLCYWFVFNGKLKLQNAFLVAVSYFFYAWWDWRFLGLIGLSSFVDYFCGLAIQRSEKESHRKRYLWLSMLVNLGLLGVLKYFNFFSQSFAEAFATIGLPMDTLTLDVVLPVGISFYTFQTMSYTIDVYRRKLQATADLSAFFAYVSFFPQLVAGPIERATNLLPQFYKKREFTYQRGAEGARLIIWGLFKKVVIADNLGLLVEQIFSNYQEVSSLTLLLGGVYFAFQIYGDFSGYSDIAIGVAKWFGFDLMTNFRVPYFSRSMAEFWRRWHISLSTWFRDYLYIPLGGSKKGQWVSFRNVMVIFLVSGFWHGANWTFLAWGALNALYFLPSFLMKNNRVHLDTVAEGSYFPTIKEGGQMILTFLLTCIAWIIFRAENITQAWDYLVLMFRFKSSQIPEEHLYHPKYFVILLFFVGVEWLVFRDEDFQERISKLPIVVRYTSYVGVVVLAFLFMQASENSFIYFQF